MEPTFFSQMVERLKPRYTVVVGIARGKYLVRLERPDTWEILTEAVADTREQALIICLGNRLVGEPD